jgi:transposase
VDRRVAVTVLAEIGTDMKPFPTDEDLASWAGICPGNDVSAGKRKRQRIPPGNRWLKRSLVQAAWAASRSKNTYLASQYRHLARRGRKKALVAVAHSMLVIFYHMLKDGKKYADLGADWFDRLEPERLTRYYVERLESLGHKVTLEPRVAA